MQNQIRRLIVGRFFEALQILKAHKIIRGKQTFALRYGINRRNLYQLEMNYDKGIFQVAWLNYLAVDFKVSSEWLLTGNGDFFLDGWDAKKVKTLQNTCKKTNGDDIEVVIN